MCALVSPHVTRFRESLVTLGAGIRFFLWCGFSCAYLIFLTRRRTLYTRSRSKVSRHCVSSCESSGYQTERKPGHTGDRNKVSLRSGFSCEFSSLLTRGKTLCTWSKSRESCQCEFFGVSSGYWTGRMISPKRCRGRAVLHYGSGGVTLSLKS